MRTVQARADNPAVQQACTWLREILQGGPRAADEVRDLAAKAAIADITLRRAKAVLGVDASQAQRAESGQRYWVWQLPGPGAATSAAAPGPTGGLRMLAVDEITVESNVRRQFDEAGLQELAGSIRANGVLEPLLVRTDPPGGWGDGRRLVLVAGERRLRASRLAGLAEVPCVVRTDLTACDAAKLQLLENLQRRDLDPIEQALGFAALIDEHGMPQRELAESMGISESFISNRRRLLRLPDEVRAHISAGQLSASVALKVVNIADVPAIAQAIGAQLATEGTTQAAADERIRQLLIHRCPVVAGQSWGPAGVTCEPAAHRNCPCRRKVGQAAVCVDPQHYADVEGRAKERQAEAQQQLVQDVRSGKTSGPIDLAHFPGEYWGPDRTYCLLEGCQADHAACPCRREAVRYGRATAICVDVAAYDKREKAAARAEGKAARTALAGELEDLSTWAQRHAAATFDGDRGALLGGPELAYLAALVLEYVRPSYDGATNEPRIRLRPYLERLQLPAGVLDSDEVDYRRRLRRLASHLLKHVAPVILWRMVLEWPLLAEGLGHGLPGWYKATVDGHAGAAAEGGA